MPRYTFPSIYRVTFIFLLVGPFLWPVVSLVLGHYFPVAAVAGRPTPFLSEFWSAPFSNALSLIFASVSGGLLWYGVSWFPNWWWGTWIPTLSAATAYWFIMSGLCKHPRLIPRLRLPWTVLNLVVCSLVSAAIFKICMGVDASLQNISRVVNETSQHWDLVVAVVGGILGLISGLRSPRFEDSGKALSQI